MVPALTELISNAGGEMSAMEAVNSDMSRQ